MNLVSLSNLTPESFIEDIDFSDTEFSKSVRNGIMTRIDESFTCYSEIYIPKASYVRDHVFCRNFFGHLNRKGYDFHVGYSYEYSYEALYFEQKYDATKNCIKNFEIYKRYDQIIRASEMSLYDNTIDILIDNYKNRLETQDTLRRNIRRSNGYCVFLIWIKE